MALVLLSCLITPTAAHGSMIEPKPRTVGKADTQWGVCGQPFDKVDGPPTSSFPVMHEFEAGKEFDVTVLPIANHGGNAWFEFICADGKDDLNAKALKDQHTNEWETLKRAASDRDKYGANSYSYLPGYDTELYWPSRDAENENREKFKKRLGEQPENFKLGEYKHRHFTVYLLVKAKYVAPSKACTHGVLRYIWDAPDEDNKPACIPCGPGKRNGKKEPSKEDFARMMQFKKFESLPYCCDVPRYSKSPHVERPWQTNGGICPQTFVNCADVRIVASTESTTTTPPPAAPTATTEAKAPTAASPTKPTVTTSSTAAPIATTTAATETPATTETSATTAMATDQASSSKANDADSSVDNTYLILGIVGGAFLLGGAGAFYYKRTAESSERIDAVKPRRKVTGSRPKGDTRKAKKPMRKE
eukprot:GEMP01019527.1.p1 GENE.GEMP01019527.1~~GEMP01019527.1.p1  ORF type:complete len:419 (+),score=75.32 GEMP01019527.1:70-1326(+)